MPGFNSRLSKASTIPPSASGVLESCTAYTTWSRYVVYPPFVLRVDQTFSRASPRPSRHLHRFNPIKSRLAPPPFFLRLRKPTMTLCALWHISHGRTLRVATSLKSVRIVPLGGYVQSLTNNKGIDPFNSGARIGRTPFCPSGNGLWLPDPFPGHSLGASLLP